MDHSAEGRACPFRLCLRDSETQTFPRRISLISAGKKGDRLSVPLPNNTIQTDSSDSFCGAFIVSQMKHKHNRVVLFLYFSPHLSRSSLYSHRRRLKASRHFPSPWMASIYLLTEHYWWLTALPTTGTYTTQSTLDAPQRHLTRGRKWSGRPPWSRPPTARPPPTAHTSQSTSGVSIDGYLGVAPPPPHYCTRIIFCKHHRANYLHVLGHRQ